MRLQDSSLSPELKARRIAAVLRLTHADYADLTSNERAQRLVERLEEELAGESIPRQQTILEFLTKHFPGWGRYKVEAPLPVKGPVTADSLPVSELLPALVRAGLRRSRASFRSELAEAFDTLTPEQQAEFREALAESGITPPPPPVELPPEPDASQAISSFVRRAVDLQPDDFVKLFKRQLSPLSRDQHEEIQLRLTRVLPPPKPVEAFSHFAREAVKPLPEPAVAELHAYVQTLGGDPVARLKQVLQKVGLAATGPQPPPPPPTSAAEPTLGKLVHVMTEIHSGMGDLLKEVLLRFPGEYNELLPKNAENTNVLQDAIKKAQAGNDQRLKRECEESLRRWSLIVPMVKDGPAAFAREWMKEFSPEAINRKTDAGMWRDAGKWKTYEKEIEGYGEDGIVEAMFRQMCHEAKRATDELGNSDVVPPPLSDNSSSAGG